MPGAGGAVVILPMTEMPEMVGLGEPGKWAIYTGWVERVSLSVLFPKAKLVGESGV